MRTIEVDIPWRATNRWTWLGVLSLFLVACPVSSRPPSIEFTEVPEAGPGGASRMEMIAGRAIGAKPGQRIVLYAKSGIWWVQPLFNKPFTAIRQDSTWSSATHIGTQYAALLVGSKYLPLQTTDILPAQGEDVIAIASVAGRTVKTPEGPPPKTIHFSGYEWEVRQTPTDSAGVMHTNSPSNAWTDAKGRLHLKISKEAGEWACAEIILQRSLGYGWYGFHLRETPELEPGTVLGMFTWDEAEAGESHREMDIELSQWGDPAARNAQFTIQPYYVPANTFRFTASARAMTYSFHWEPSRVSFTSAQEAPGVAPRVLAEHVFSSGIPTPGDERVHINLYVYGKSQTPQRNGVEAVIENFEFLP